MNIICNNCVGARLYEVTQQRFPNPFMWNFISDCDFVKLLNEYNNLNLENTVFSLEYYKKNDYESVLATLENGVKLHFIHYIQNDFEDSPIKKYGTDILYKDIITYAKTKWFSRLKRSSEPATFLFSFNYAKKDNPKYYEVLGSLLSCTCERLIVLVHDSVKVQQVIPNNINLIKCNDDVMGLGNGRALVNYIKDIIFRYEK